MIFTKSLLAHGVAMSKSLEAHDVVMTKSAHDDVMTKSLKAHGVVMTKKFTVQFCCRPVDVPVRREQLHVLQHQVSCLQLDLRLSQGNNSSSYLKGQCHEFLL
jgi:hypothetical protein